MIPQRVVNQRAVDPVREDARGDVERNELAAVRGIDRDAHVDRAPDVALHLLIDLEPVEPLRDAVARDDRWNPVERPTNTTSASAMRWSSGVVGQVYACAVPVNGERDERR